MISNSQIGIRGRLGNQLYQYALLKAIEARTGHKAYRPIVYKDTDNSLPLQDGTNALAGFLLTMPEWPIKRNFTNLFMESKLGPRYHSEVFDQPDNTVFVGYYQSWRYFDDIRNDIRREFRFRPDIEEKALEIFAPLRSPIVTVNVRRGDYTLPPFNTFFTQLDIDYYRRAMARFTSNHIFVFVSDDIEWCKTHFKGHHYIQSGNHWVDMCCITLADHHIIANSSFAWWAAWLNSKAGKRVIAPAEWYQSGQHPHWLYTDHCPPEWEKEAIS